MLVVFNLGVAQFIEALTGNSVVWGVSLPAPPYSRLFSA